VHITAICPRCATPYQVQPDLLGQSMRCPRPECRAVFVVSEPLPGAVQCEPPPVRRFRPGSAGAAGQQGGSVGDLVPILPARAVDPEVAARPQQPPAPERASEHVSDLLPLVEAAPAEPADLHLELDPWPAPGPQARGPGAPDPPAKSTPTRAAPARRNRPFPDAEPAEPAPPSVADRTPAPEPEVLGPGAWEAPPVRLGADCLETPNAQHETLTTEPATPGQGSEGHAGAAAPPRHTRWTKWGVIGFVVGVVGVLGAGGVAVWLVSGQSEEKMAELAAKEYADRNYRAAADLYGQIPQRFPDSDNAERYQFLAALSDLRARIAEGSDSNPVNTLEAVEGFVKDRPPKDPLLHEFAPDVGESVVKLLLGLSEQAAKEPTDETPAQVLRARQTVEVVRKVTRGKGLSKAELARLEEAFAKVAGAVAKMQERRAVLARLDEEARTPSFAAIGRAQRLVREKEAILPGIGTDAEVVRRIERLYDAHLASVRYVEDPVPADKRSRAEEDVAGILFASAVASAPDTAGDDDPIVLALARGVLYALKQGTGRPAWAVRVGIDTTALPVRVPATAGSSERILVLSSDTATLTAYDTKGHPLWRHRLRHPCLGRPVVVGSFAYLPTVDGEVHEIELAGGLLRGRYLLGQRLTRGGTREPGSNRVYFPADDHCVYVLDVARRKCEGVLYSGHPGGSLRSEALVVTAARWAGGRPPRVVAEPRYLILNQTEGLHRVRLRVFDLPLSGRHAAARELGPQAGLAGWTWFAPHLDPEKLVLLSDAGVLGLFGIRQARNADAELFPWLPGGGLDVSAYLRDEGPWQSVRRRSEVVQVAGDDLWVLAGGRLQRLRLAWGAGVGPEVVRGWPRALPLGSPLHASQVVEDPLAGRSTLFLVTQPPRRATCWATAVDDDQGRVLWQRELGLVCQGEPLALPAAQGGPLLLALDQSGALFGLDPTRFPSRPGVPWQSDNRRARLAGSLEGSPDDRPLLVPAPDGKSAYALACPGGGNDLVVRHVRPAAKGRELELTEGKVRLPAPLAGTPAVVGPWLVCPLADGTFARVSLPVPEAGAEAEGGGADWRAARVGSEARGHVVALDKDRFLTTDGFTGLACWRWPADKKKLWEALPVGRDSETPTCELGAPLVGAPLRLPDRPGKPVRLCVADAGGALTLLEVRADGSLERRPAWNLGGRVTAGPFLRSLAGGAVRVGCVVDEKRLVWVDPEREDVAWAFASDSALVGQPQLAGDLLVVADQSGRYRGLNPATGKPVGPGYQLRGSIAPAASPVAFGPGRLLAPLSDGTALLLPLGRVDHPLRGFPMVW
jgi:hypothetical protein